jgi:hypothetical protein
MMFSSRTIIKEDCGTNKPVVKYIDGSKKWFLDGKLHRRDGPAVEYKDGKREWYFNGKRHREDIMI